VTIPGHGQRQADAQLQLQVLKCDLGVPSRPGQAQELAAGNSSMLGFCVYQVAALHGEGLQQAGSKRRGRAPPDWVNADRISGCRGRPLRGQVPAGRYGSSIACDRQTRWNASRAGGILTPVCRQRGGFCLAWTKICDAKLRSVVRHGPYPRGEPGSARQAEATSPAGGEMSRLRLRESDLGLARRRTPPSKPV
jgi:hypothetical protein